MANDRTLTVKFEGESSGLEKGTKQAEQAVGGFAGKLKGASAGIAGFLGGIAGGAVVAGIGAAKDAIVDFVGGSLTAASDLKESANVVGLVWGDAAAGMQGFFDSAASSLGMSKSAAQEAAAGVGGLLQNMGFANSESADWSQKLLTLSADMGSAFNAEPSEAIAAIGAGLRGEAEPLKRFNVFLSDAAVQAEAMSMGLVKGKRPLTEHEKAQARLSLVMKQTSKVQGDFANTSDGAANGSRVNAAKVDDLKAKIGAGLLPIQERWLGFMNNALIPAAGKVVDWLGQMGSGVAAAAQQISQWISPITDTVRLFIGTITGEGADVDLPWMDAVIDAGAQVGGIFDTLKQAWADFGASVQAAVATYIQPAMAQFWGVIQQARDTVMPIITQITAFVASKWAEWGPTIQLYLGQAREILTGIMQAIMMVVSRVMSVIAAVVSRVLGVIRGFWQSYGSQILSVVSTVFNTIMRVIGGVLRVIQGIVKTFLSILKGDWRGALDGVKQIVSGVWQTIKAVFSGGIDAVKGVVKVGLSFITDRFRDMKNGVVGIWDGMVSTVRGAVDRTIGAIKGPIRNMISWLNSNVISPVNNVIGNLGLPQVPHIPSFHSGGMIPGRRERLAMVMGGEGVLTGQAVSRIGGPQVLDALNAGRLDIASIVRTEPAAAAVDVDSLVDRLATVLARALTPVVSVGIDEGDITRVVEAKLRRHTRKGAPAW